MASRRKAGSDSGDVKGQEQTPEEKQRQRRHNLKAEYERIQRKKSEIWRWSLVAVVLVIAAVGLYYYIVFYRAPSLEEDTTVGNTQNVTKSQKSSGATKTKGSANTKTKGAKSKGDPGTKAGAKSKGDPGTKAGAKSKGDPGTKAGAKSKGDPGTKAGAKSKGDPGTKAGAKSKGDPGTKAGAKSKGNPKKENPGKKNYSRREGNMVMEELNLDEIRLLRRPIAVSDPDRPYIMEILMGDNLLLEGRYSVALEKFNEIVKMFPQSPRALYGKGEALQGMAKEKNSNKLMDTAIDFYYKVGMGSFLATEDVTVEALLRLSEVAHTRGKYPLAIKALERLCEIQSENPSYANQLGVAYLTSGNTRKARAHFNKVLETFPESSFAKAHIGYMLFVEKKYEAALPMLLEGIHSARGVRTNAKFYLYAGECLTKLNRTDEAFAVYSEAVSLELLPSVWQRSLYNEPALTARPWWTAEESGYGEGVHRIQDSLEAIREEASSLVSGDQGTFTANNPHFLLFSNGKKDAENCKRAPRTCALIESFPEATGCKRGETKFTVFPPHTHALPHVGPTNTRVEIIVGLETQGLRIRVAEETRTLETGDILILDDSFEKEVWHEGSEVSIVLTVDLWHPDLTEAQWRKLGLI